MKENEVPQDDANIFDGKTKSIQYATDSNGKYIQVKSVGFEPSNIAIQRAWEEVQEKIDEALKEVKSGTKSPIYYFMRKEIMDISILSETVKIPKWRVKRHLKPKVFVKLNDKILKKYGDAFGLSNIELLKHFSINE